MLYWAPGFGNPLCGLLVDSLITNSCVRRCTGMRHAATGQYILRDQTLSLHRQNICREHSGCSKQRRSSQPLRVALHGKAFKDSEGEDSGLEQPSHASLHDCWSFQPGKTSTPCIDEETLNFKPLDAQTLRRLKPWLDRWLPGPKRKSKVSAAPVEFFLQS